MEHALRTYRRIRDITLEQLATETGLSKSHLSEIEGGKRPGSKSIEILIKKTGLPANAFFSGGGPLADPVIPSSSCSVAGQEGTTINDGKAANVDAEIANAHR